LHWLILSGDEFCNDTAVQTLGTKDVNIKDKIGARIASLRKARRMTQEQLAAKMEISIPYLSSIERGRENPTLNTLINLARCLDLDLSEMFSHIEIEDPLQRKVVISSLLSNAEDEQLKQALKVLTALLR
jgi:transcriptional regulator with XRE-family HTH domain